MQQSKLKLDIVHPGCISTLACTHSQSMITAPWCGKVHNLVPMQGPDGIIQLQSAGVTLPDRALRWLTPLSRPLPTPSTAATPQEQPSTTTMYSPDAVDTVMQEAQIDKEHQPLLQQPKVEHSLQQGIVQDSKLQQSGSNQAGTQPSAHATAPDAAQPSAPSSMVVDDLPPANPLPAPHSQPDPGASFAGPAPLHQHLLTSPQRQLQTISVSADVQEIVHGSALKCDRQLLAKQEEILVRLVQQRVEAEVREVQGPQDMDDGAVELADKVSSVCNTCPHYTAYPCYTAGITVDTWHALMCE